MSDTSPKTPSTIRWSRFTNDRPSSITELWPPYDFTRNSGASLLRGDQRRSCASSSEWLSCNESNVRLSDASVRALVKTPAHCPQRSGENVASRRGKHESHTTRSLRRFVEREIGLDAIRFGHSADDVKESATSRRGLGDERGDQGFAHRGSKEGEGEMLECEGPAIGGRNRDGYDEDDEGGPEAGGRKKKRSRSRSLSSSIRRFFHLEEQEYVEGLGKEMNVKVLVKEMRSSVLKGFKEVVQKGR